jgi:hypothetical protein
MGKQQFEPLGSRPPFLKLTEIPGELKSHPIADELIPPFEGEAFDVFVNHVKRHGFVNPVILLAQGRILDGRARYAAARLTGRAAELLAMVCDEDHDGAVKTVVNCNVERLHLKDRHRTDGRWREPYLEDGRPAHIDAADVYRRHLTEAQCAGIIAKAAARSEALRQWAAAHRAYM